jgi:hypothetical protein
MGRLSGGYFSYAIFSIRFFNYFTAAPCCRMSFSEAVQILVIRVTEATIFCGTVVFCG